MLCDSNAGAFDHGVHHVGYALETDEGLVREFDVKRVFEFQRKIYGIERVETQLVPQHGVWTHVVRNCFANPAKLSQDLFENFRAKFSGHDRSSAP